MTYMHHISSLPSTPTSQTPSAGTFPDGTRRLELLLGGYSYGALLSIQLPPLQSILDQFKRASMGSAEAEIRLRAERLVHGLQRAEPRGRQPRASALLHGEPAFVYGGEESEPGTRRPSRDLPRSMEILRHSLDRSRRRLGGRPSSDEHLPSSPRSPRSPRTEMRHADIAVPLLRFLLVSPLLPPLSWLIATSTSSLSMLGAQPKTYTESSDCSGEGKLHRNRTLVVYGNKDSFTSAKRLQKWSAQLRNKSSSGFQSREVDGVSHFWLEDSADSRLRAAITEWLRNDVT